MPQKTFLEKVDDAVHNLKHSLHLIEKENEEHQHHADSPPKTPNSDEEKVKGKAPQQLKAVIKFVERKSSKEPPRSPQDPCRFEDYPWKEEGSRSPNDWESQLQVPDTILNVHQIIKRNVRRVKILYNPYSGAHKGGVIARRTETLLDKAHIEYESVELQEKGHAEKLCQYLLDIQDVDAILVVGGDGTFHEAINGWMNRSHRCRQMIPLAMIPGGTGNSFSLELHGHTSVRKTVEYVVRGIHTPIDIAKIEHDNEVIYSFNSLHWGLASKINVTAERFRWMGKARYTTASLLELIRGEKTRAKIAFEEADGNVIEYDEEFCLVIANNIGTAAKGMKMAPQARLDDGLIDLIIIRSSKSINLLNIFRKVYEGTHTDLSYVEYRQVKSFSITPLKSSDNAGLEEVEEIIDIDGELKGSTPFKCTVIPSALRVII